MTKEKLCRAIAAADLPEASLAEVLLYGLTLGDEDPALGVLLAARRELGLIADLAESSRPGEIDRGELVPVLESIGRRLDVAIELFSRAQRVDRADTMPERAPGVAPDEAEGS